MHSVLRPLFAFVLSFVCTCFAVDKTDIVVYGGTPGGVMAAVAAARHGDTVALVDINAHVGGVVSGGLTATDIGDRKTVGGLANEFFARVLKHYVSTYGKDSPQVKDCHDGFKFEPKVAEMIFEQMLNETKKVTIWRSNRYRSATLDGTRITELITDDVKNNVTRTFAADVFIDASYEGDLMAGARVPYRVGREARAEFGEYLAGLSEGPKALRGLGDHRTMSYNFRMCITSETANRVLFPKPDHYDPEPFRKTDGARAIKGSIKGFGNLFTTTVGKAGPNQKYDANWGDFVGNSEGYAEADWETRERIANRERDYFLSRLYYLQNDPELPEAFRKEVQGWGLPKDEFADNNHLPFQFYVREARRMMGAYIMRESDLTQERWKPDGICSGSYGVDCHWIQWMWNDGRYETEQTQHVALHPYDIPYRSLIAIDHPNLIVPVCLSSSHVGYCSTRMEPVFMMLGHAAGDAAHLAVTAKQTVQQVDTAKLRETLRAEGAILDAGYMPQVRILWTPEHPKVGEAVHFTAKEGTLLEPISQTWWDFDGNGTVAAQGRKAEHSFTADKVYTVSLLVEDKSGRRRLVTAEIPVGLAIGKDITVDDFDADNFGRWDGTRVERIIKAGVRQPDVAFGPGVHRDVVRAGKKSPARIQFAPDLPRAGRYQVCIGFRAGPGQATNTPVTIKHAGGTEKLTVNQRKEATPFNFTPVGEFKFRAGQGSWVQLANGGTDGAVVVDAVRWIWLGE